jgi:Icc-related predicted phosphoesterase
LFNKAKEMKITFISDTHTKHRQLYLEGGDLLVHAGDIMNSGYSAYEIQDFCKWFEAQDYDVCAFIAGNHDRMFENEPEKVAEIVNSYGVDYMQDSGFEYGDFPDEMVKIYGSPWQPEFYNWAFNLPRCGEELGKVWNNIPEDVDILVTHGPPQGHLDVSGEPWYEGDLGCEILRHRVDTIKPKIHVFGHIHGSYGYKFHDGTHFINASVLNERYSVVNDPLTVEWDPDTNEIEFL